MTESLTHARLAGCPLELLTTCDAVMTLGVAPAS